MIRTAAMASTVETEVKSPITSNLGNTGRVKWKEITKAKKEKGSKDERK